MPLTREQQTKINTAYKTARANPDLQRAAPTKKGKAFSDAPTFDAFVADLKSSDPAISDPAHGQLKKFGPVDSALVPLLAAELDAATRGRGQHRHVATIVLGRIADASAIDALAARVAEKTESNDVRYQATKALRRIEQVNK